MEGNFKEKINDESLRKLTGYYSMSATFVGKNANITDDDEILAIYSIASFR